MANATINVWPPGGSTVTGLAATYIPFGASATAMSASADFTYNDTTKLVTITGGANGGLKVGNLAYATPWTLDLIDSAKGNCRWGNATIQGFLARSGSTIDIGSSTNHPVDLYTNNTLALRLTTGQLVQFAAAASAANGTGTVTVGNLAPGTVNVTIQKWIKINDSAGTTYQIPVFNVT